MDGQIDNSYFVLNNFYNNFMTLGSETALTGGVIKLFTIDQVQTFVNTTVQNYYNINSEYRKRALLSLCKCTSVTSQL